MESSNILGQVDRDSITIAHTMREIDGFAVDDQQACSEAPPQTAEQEQSMIGGSSLLDARPQSGRA
jgi:hypothetical protein